jgi:hypothetical protein
MTTEELRAIAKEAFQQKINTQVETVYQIIVSYVPMHAKAGDFSYIYTNYDVNNSEVGDKVVQRLKDEMGWNVHRTGASIVVRWGEPEPEVKVTDPTPWWKVWL